MTDIKLKRGSGVPLSGDLEQGEPALDLTNKRLYTSTNGSDIVEVGTNPSELTVTGNVTGANLNIANWDEAYGWGNHADAGYLTSAETASLDEVTTAGNSTTNSITVGGVTISSDLTVDTDTLFVDASTDRVGINTATPSVALDVNGEAKATTVTATGNITGANLNIANWDEAYSWGNHADAGYLTSTTPTTITITGDVTGSGTDSIDLQLASNVVGANELNVTGNGTTAQFLRSDGDGSFSWATPTDTNTTYSAGNGIDLSGTTFTVSSGNGLSQTATGLQMSGTYTGNFTATGNVTAYSDERLKSDVETLDGSKVYQMRGVLFTKDGQKGSGVIAQELQKVAPELVEEGEEYLSVAYGNIVGYLIEAVKALKTEIEELKNGSST
jgi:hypothetical protein